MSSRDNPCPLCGYVPVNYVDQIMHAKQNHHHKLREKFRND